MISPAIPSSSSTRRRFLAAAAASVCLPALLAASRAAAQDTPSRPFSFDLLTEEARNRAAGPAPEAEAIPQVFAEMTYDDYNFIAYRPARARWNVPDITWRLMPFHLGWLFKEPVHLFEVVDEVSVDFIHCVFEIVGANDEVVVGDDAFPHVVEHVWVEELFDHGEEGGGSKE